MPEIPTGKALLDSPALIAVAGIDYGMKVADLGCGTLGHFTFPAAHAVGGEGKVYAVDILKNALSAVESRAKVEGVDNVETLWGDLEMPGGVRIPDGTIDLVFLVNVASLVKKSPSVAEQVKRILREDGRLLAIDWRPGTKGFGPGDTHRVPAEEIRDIFTDLGFTVKKEFDAGPNHWGLLLEKS